MRISRRLVPVTVIASATVLSLAAMPSSSAVAATATVSNLSTVIREGLGNPMFDGSAPAINAAGVTTAETSATATGTPTETDNGDIVYLGTYTYTNSTDSDQPYIGLPTFSKSLTDTLETSTTTGVSNSNAITATANFGEVASLGNEFTTTWDFSSTSSTSQATDMTYTAGGGYIDVPAMTTVTVVDEVEEGTVTGNMALDARFNGSFTFAPTPKTKTTESLYNQLETNLSTYTDPNAKAGDGIYGTPKKTVCYGYASLPSGFTMDSANQTLDFAGSGTYTATIGLTENAVITSTPYTGTATTTDSTSAAKAFGTAIAGDHEITAPRSGTITVQTPVTTADKKPAA
jgi:hypothetical protein